MESATYKAIKEEGIKEGIERARLVLAGICREGVRARLGALPPEAAAIESLSVQELERLIERVVAAASPEAVREALRNLK
jgi:hypothetical protein